MPSEIDRIAVKSAPGMNAARSGAMSSTRDAPSGVAIGDAAKAPPHAVAQALLRKAAIRRIRILEDQLLESLALARFAVREPPQQKPAVTAAPRRIGKSHAADGRVAQRFHEWIFRMKRRRRRDTGLVAKTGPGAKIQRESLR